MMEKKLCVVTTTSITIKSFLIKQLEYLSQNGYIVTVICNQDPDFAKELPESIQYKPIVMNRGVEGIGMLKSIWSLYRIFKKEKFDIVQYSTPNAAFYSSLAAKMAKIPIRLYCQWGIRYVGYVGWKRQIFKIIEKLTCMFSTQIEPDSHGNLHFGRKEKLYSTIKSKVVWNGSANGVDLKQFNIAKKELWRSQIREQYHIKEHEFVFGFIGRITKDKGINELLYAFKSIYERHISKVKLIIVGPDDQVETVDSNIYEWSLQCEDVIYCGFKKEIEKYYAAMDVFLLPSYREGFGSVVIEAQVMGVPVIVSDIPGPTNAIKQNVTGLVVPKGKIKPLKEAMEKMYKNKKLSHEMGLNAYLFSRDHFEQRTLWEHILRDRDELLIRGKTKNVQG